MMLRSLIILALAAIAVAMPIDHAAAGSGILQNGNFDDNVADWELLTDSPVNTITFAANQDADGNPNSGAAELRINEVVEPPFDGYGEAMAQCVPVVPSTQYTGGARVRIATLNQVADTEADLRFFWYSNANCAGSHVASGSTPPVFMSDNWQGLAQVIMAPANAHSLYLRLQLNGEDPPGPTRSYAYFDKAALNGALGPLPGDVNCDRAIDSIDAVLILQDVAGLPVNFPCPAHSDANDDGQTTSIDSALILQFSAALIDTLPP